MNLLDFFAAGPNLPFLVSGCVVIALLIINVVGLLLGAGFEAFQHNVDINADLNGNGIPDYLETNGFSFSHLLNPGHVPSGIFMILLLGFFSLIGFSAQWIYKGATGSLAPLLVSVPLTLAMTFVIVRFTTQIISPILPKDESTAVTVESLTGDTGVVTAGPIGPNSFGVARFTDKHGTDHSIVVASNSEEVIANGEAVVLLGPSRTSAIAYLVRKI